MNETHRPSRIETGIRKPEIPLELGEIDEAAMRIWFDSFEKTPEGFQKLAQEISAANCDPETVNKWLWLIINTRETPSPKLRDLADVDAMDPRLVERCGENESVDLTDHYHLPDSEEAFLLYYTRQAKEGLTHSYLSQFCQNNPDLIPLLMSEYHRKFLPYNIEEVPFLASPAASNQRRTGDLAYWQDEMSALTDHMELDLKPGILHRAFGRARYHALTPVMEITARTYMPELSDEQAEKYCDSSIDALMAGEPFFLLFNQIDWLAQAGSHAVARVMKELHKINQETDDKFFHLNERRRYILIHLLRCLEKKPVPIDPQQKKCHILETDIFLPDDLPETAAAVEIVSGYGELGVFDERCGLLGSFSFFDLQPQGSGFRANYQPLSEMELFKDFNEADVNPGQRDKVKAMWQERFPVGNKLLQAMPLREQAWFYHVVHNLGAADFDRLEELSLGNPLLLRCCLLAYAHSGFTELNVAEAIASSNHTKFVRSWRQIIPKEQVAAILGLGADYRFDPKTEVGLIQLLGANVYDRLPEYQTPDAVDTFVRMVDSAEQRAFSLQAELAEEHPKLIIDRSVLVRGLVRREVAALGTYRDGQAQRKTYFMARLRENFKFHCAIGACEELAGLTDKQEHIDLSIFRQEQEFLAGLLLADAGLREEVVNMLMVEGKLVPTPEPFWRADRDMREYNERSGLNVASFLADLSPAEDDPAKRAIAIEFGSGSGVAISERFHDPALRKRYYEFSLNREVHYSVRTLIAKLIDVEKLGLSDKKEQDLFIDYVYKTMYADMGRTAEDDVLGNRDIDGYDFLSGNPNSLKMDLRAIGGKLLTAKAVASEVGVVPDDHGRARYKKKIRLGDQSEKFQRAIYLFRVDPVRYLRPEVDNQDLRALIPISPVGLILGDFLDSIQRFKDDQIKVAGGIRSVVYLQSQQYIDFHLALHQKLQPGGCYWGDCVRENFGRRYRLPELAVIRKGLPRDSEIYLVQGPGVPGDDYNKKAAIRGVVVTKGEFDSDIIRRNVMPQYGVRSLQEVLADKSYLDRLYHPKNTRSRSELADI